MRTLCKIDSSKWHYKCPLQYWSTYLADGTLAGTRIDLVLRGQDRLVQDDHPGVALAASDICAPSP
jgi:hypothetical protein